MSDFAGVPRKAFAPKVNVILALSILLGLGAGALLAIALEAFDNRIRTQDDAVHALGIPSLGYMPAFALAKPANSPGVRSRVGNLIPLAKERLLRSRKAKPGLGERFALEPLDAGNSDIEVESPGKAPAHPELVTLSTPNASISEALRTIRASLLFSSVDNPMQVLMVTSASEGEGKTSLAANLAVTLAQSSHRTLLIDADLRSPSCDRYFNIDPARPGLADILVGHRQLGECVVQIDTEDLFVLPAGSDTPNPAEMLGSKKMSELLEYLTKGYDYIVIDSPPVLPVADPLLLSRFVDSTLFVVRSGETRKPAAKEAIARLRRAGARIAGMIVTAVPEESSEYGAYGAYGQNGKSRRRGQARAFG